MSDYIPEGIQVHILKLLPVKSLLRFRCVCKWWKQFIDSPTFMQEHLAVQKPRFLAKESNEPGFVVVDPSAPLRLVDTLIGPTAYVNDKFHVYGTLHGVVCLYEYSNNLLIWNPSIRKFFHLPLPLEYEWAFRKVCGCCYSFWIDPSNKEFQIMALFFNIEDVDEEGWPMDVDYGVLYSSILHDWISVIPPPPGEVAGKWKPWNHLSTGKSVIIGRVAHWEGLYEIRNDQGHRNKTRVIMSYDFRKESFEFIEMHNLSSLASFHPTLCHWQGALSLLYWDDKISNRCDLYSRQEGSWVNLFGVDLLAPVVGVLWPLEGMEESGRALVRQRDDRSGAKLVLYDTRAGCIPLTRGSWHVDVANDFVESLLFPYTSSIIGLCWLLKITDLAPSPFCLPPIWLKETNIKSKHKIISVGFYNQLVQ